MEPCIIWSYQTITWVQLKKVIKSLTKFKKTYKLVTLTARMMIIASLSHYQMTKLVKEKIREQADTYLLSMKAKHVRTSKLFPTPHLREYLTSDEINTDEKKLLFKLRISMIQLK